MYELLNHFLVIELKKNLIEAILWKSWKIKVDAIRINTVTESLLMRQVHQESHRFSFFSCYHVRDGFLEIGWKAKWKEMKEGLCCVHIMCHSRPLFRNHRKERRKGEGQPCQHSPAGLSITLENHLIFGKENVMWIC